MWSSVVLYLTLLPAASVCSPGSSGTDSLAEKGQAELLHVRRLAKQPLYGECWARALADIEASCRELTEERQSRMALKFTHCHLHRSGRKFPACPEGAELSECTADMDAVAFNAFTEFFTHTLSICHFLQSEAWQLRAESSMQSLTEASASVAEQLSSTRLLTEDLLEAQSSALMAQDQILLNGQELQHTIRESSQGVRELFSQVTDSSREQQVVLSELFNRISFLQSFVLLEAHTLSSGLYNAAGLCTSFLLTCTPHTARSRLVLLGLVCVNVCLERLIYQCVMDSSNPAHSPMELVTRYVAVLRRIMGTLGVLILVLAALRYRDPNQDSLLVLAQLRDTQHSLQLALTHTEGLRVSAEHRRSRSGEEDMWRRKEVLHTLPRSCYRDDQINVLFSCCYHGDQIEHNSHVATTATRSRHNSHVVTMTARSTHYSHVVTRKTRSTNDSHVVAVTARSTHYSHVVTRTTRSTHYSHVKPVLPLETTRLSSSGIPTPTSDQLRTVSPLRERSY